MNLQRHKKKLPQYYILNALDICEFYRHAMMDEVDKYTNLRLPFNVISISKISYT